MKSILIVEDERVIAASIRNVLRLLEYQDTRMAESSSEAIEMIEESAPDLVLADISLEGEVDGIEMANIIRAKYKIPVIFVTAHSDQKTVEQAKMSEPYGFITKPFKVEELRITLEIAFYKSHMEKKLIESKEKYRTLTETVEDVIFTLDPKGKFTFLSPAFDKITGFKAADYIGHHFTEILVPNYSKNSLNEFAESMNGDTFNLYEIEILHKKKGSIAVEINATNLYDKNNKNKGMIGSLRDITERKKSEEALRKAYTMLENAQQELVQNKTLANLGEFAAGIAHEIRNPLANISALAQYSMKKFELDELMVSNLEAIIKSSERANKIIRELLNFAKPIELKFEKVDVIETLNKVCEMSEAKRLNNQVKLHKTFPETLPQISIDEKQMEQALLNIIMNALDAMPDGGDLTLYCSQKDGNIIIEISDTGNGISERKKIFNPFFTQKAEGVGLGLSVTHRVIKSHKGKIEVESTQGKGTVFTISLPIELH